MNTAAQSRFVVRPTLGLLLRRVFNSADGWGFALSLVLVPAIIVGLAGPVAGIAVGGVLLLAVVAVLARTRMEVTPDRLIIANLLRVRRFTGAEVANIGVQTVSYRGDGGTVAQAHRLAVVTTEVDGKTGAPAVWPAFATERKARDAVEGMLQNVVRTLAR